MAKSKRITHVALWILLLGLIGSSLYFSHQADLEHSGQRNLATPSGRMIGHWQVYSGSDVKAGEIYIAQVQENGFGELYVTDPSGLIFHHRYSIVSEKKHGRRIRIRHYLSKDDSRTEDLEVSQNGLSAQHTQVFFDELLTRRMQYLGPEIEPDYDAETASSSEVRFSR